MYQQYQNPHSWLTGAAQGLQVSKNREGTVSRESTSEDSLQRSREAASIGLEKECYAALEGEVEIKGDFFKRSGGGITRDTRPSKEELQQLSKWMVEEIGSKKDVAAVKDKSWIWQMYCLLSEDRRMQTLYPQCKALMLEAAERLEGSQIARSCISSRSRSKREGIPQGKAKENHRGCWSRKACDH